MNLTLNNYEIIQIIIGESYIEILRKLYMLSKEMRTYLDELSKYLANKYQINLEENNFYNFIYQYERKYYFSYCREFRNLKYCLEFAISNENIELYEGLCESCDEIPDEWDTPDGLDGNDILIKCIKENRNKLAKHIIDKYFFNYIKTKFTDIAFFGNKIIPLSGGDNTEINLYIMTKYTNLS